MRRAVIALPVSDHSEASCMLAAKLMNPWAFLKPEATVISYTNVPDFDLITHPPTFPLSTASTNLRLAISRVTTEEQLMLARP